MESPALVAALAAGAGAGAMLLLVTVVLAVTRRRRRVDLEAVLADAQREVDSLRRRLDELTGESRRDGDEVGAVADPAFVITHVGEPESTTDQLPVPDRLVLSATLGEPLVKVAAFSHGLRRALSAESRNRIWFEIRREVRSSRRRRRHLRRELEREYRARMRAMEDVA